jgi:hypothetical protein
MLPGFAALGWIEEVCLRYFDVFNGDADGICALHQLRLADPLDSILVTGLKREIALLKSVPAENGDVVTALDISLERNREALGTLLERGVVVHYFDHHEAGAAGIPRHDALLAIVDGDGATCTSALVDRYLGGRFRPWAVVGAYGDNQAELAARLGTTKGLDAGQLGILRELGADLNYNSYGASADDVLIAPAALYRIVRDYADPFELVRAEAVIRRIDSERRADLDRALAAKPLRRAQGSEAYLLPDASWSRRVSGTFANRLALDDPQRAHAVLTPEPSGGFVVSVRSPRGRGITAAELCRRFAGGGRATAAGIDRLDAANLEQFLDSFDRAWSVEKV